MQSEAIRMDLKELNFVDNVSYSQTRNCCEREISNNLTLVSQTQPFKAAQ